MQHYFVEVTDTFGGEANYCWVARYKVAANTPLGAVLAVKRERGYVSITCAYDTDDECRYDVVGQAICMFVHEWDDSDGKWHKVQTLEAA